MKSPRPFAEPHEPLDDRNAELDAFEAAVEDAIALGLSASLRQRLTDWLPPFAGDLAPTRDDPHRVAPHLDKLEAIERDVCALDAAGAGYQVRGRLARLLPTRVAAPTQTRRCRNKGKRSHAN